MQSMEFKRILVYNKLFNKAKREEDLPWSPPPFLLYYIILLYTNIRFNAKPFIDPFIAVTICRRNTDNVCTGTHS